MTCTLDDLQKRIQALRDKPKLAQDLDAAIKESEAHTAVLKTMRDEVGKI